MFHQKSSPPAASHPFLPILSQCEELGYWRSWGTGRGGVLDTSHSTFVTVFESYLETVGSDRKAGTFYLESRTEEIAPQRVTASSLPCSRSELFNKNPSMCHCRHGEMPSKTTFSQFFDRMLPHPSLNIPTQACAQDSLL